MKAEPRTAGRGPDPVPAISKGQGLYLITDRNICPGNDLIDAVFASLSGGVRLVQLREKDLSTKDLFGYAVAMRELTRRFDARLIINGRLDIALSAGADGAHLGTSGIPARDARALLGKDSLVGVSTHTIEEAIAAEKAGADYVTFGPVFHTLSKAAYGRPAGLNGLENAVKAVNIPVYALGGIDKERVKDVLQCGAFGVAVISAILGQADIKGSAQSLLKEVLYHKERL